MKKTWIHSLACSAVLTVPLSARLLFLSGETMEATFLSQQGESTQVQFPWHENPVLVPSRLIDRVSMEWKGKPGPAPHRFILSNGDTLRGTLLSLSDESAVIKTSWGSEIEVDRQQIQNVTFSNSGGVLYQGGTRVQDWKVTNQDSRFRHHSSGGTIAEGRLGLMMDGRTTIERKLPTSSEGLSLQVDMHFDTPYPNLTILMNDLLREGNEKIGVHIYFSSSTIYGRTVQNNRHSVDWRIRTSEVPSLLQGDSKILLTYAPKEMKMSLWLNDVLLHEWEYEGRKPAKGKNFTLQVSGRNPNGEIWIRNVSLMRGVFVPPEENPSKGTSQDQVLLGNQDTLSGNVKSIGEENVQILIPGREELLPLQKRVVSSVDFQNQDRVIPKRKNEDVRLILLDGSQLTVQLQDVTKRKFQVATGAMQDSLDIPAGQVKIVDYNPYTLSVSERGDAWMKDQLNKTK